MHLYFGGNQSIKCNTLTAFLLFVIFVLQSKNAWKGVEEMASVNFEKIKTAGEAKAKFRHCDMEERLKHEHANEQINKAVTSENSQMSNRNYKQTCERYDKRIQELDNSTNTNKRSDRVTCMGLCIPAPEGLPKEREIEWFNAVTRLAVGLYGRNNLLQLYVHRDEIHDYVNAETGETQTSRVHAHLFFIPEHEGKLNGKWFSSRKNMISLNNQIQKMSEEQFGVKFMDGSKRKSKKTVEELKNDSRLAELAQRESEIEDTRVVQRSEAVRLFEKKQELNKREQALNDREKALNARESDLKQKEDKLHLEQEKAVIAQMRAKQRVSELEEENEAFKKNLKSKAKQQVQTYIDSVKQEMTKRARRNGEHLPDTSWIQEQSDDFDFHL